MTSDGATPEDLLSNEMDDDGLAESDPPAFAGPALTPEDLTAEVAADAAARHALGESMPVLGSSFAAPLADGEESDAAWESSAETEAGLETLAEGRAEEVAGATGVAMTPRSAVGELDGGMSAAAEPMAEPLHLERKHLIGIRWMHWINFPVLFTMIWSGLLIYWNDSDNAYQHPHRVYQIGIGNLTLFRFFPDWMYTLIHAQYNVTKGLGYHFFFMWIFAINGVLYALYLLVTREWKFMVPDRNSIREAIQVTLIDMRLLKRPLPFQTKYNGAQKIAYTSIVLMGMGSLVTGLAIYKPTSAGWLTTLLGGYEMARWLHFLLTIGFCAFFLVHVYQVAAAGWNNFRAMVTGYELRRAGEPSLDAERSRF